MGRAKIDIEPIKNDKKRSITFNKRKDGINKKVRELEKLCDVDISMIIYSNNQKHPEIFPPDHPKFERLVNLYRQNSIIPGRTQSYGLSDYFNDRKHKIEDELSKARKKTREAMFPTWFDFLNNYPETQLREFSLMLVNKIEYVKRKIEIKKISKIQNLDCYPFYPVVDGQSSYLIPPLLNPDVGFYVDQNDVMMQSLNQPNSVMKMMPLDYNNLGFDFGESSNPNYNGCNSYRENLIFNGHPVPLPEYFYTPHEYGFSPEIMQQPEAMPPAFMHIN